MPRQDILIIAAWLALFSLPDFPGARDASNSGSLHMTMNAGWPPIGVADAPARTTRDLILADERKPDGAPEPSQSGNPLSPPSPPEPAADPSDPGSNRDLERSQRASPEASNDLFQLLKQAGPKRGSKPK
jgi:hypothetical protein